jgi:8-amino-7-oxononanoate synthase
MATQGRTMRSLDEFAAEKLGELERSSLRRELTETTRLDGIRTRRNGRLLLSFCCNDYLNLSHHPTVVEAASEALRMYGVGAGASRLVTGNHPLYAKLERRLARLKQTQAACVFGSGFLANLGIIPALVGSRDLVLIDELAHSCLWGGARLSRATVTPFRHCDTEHVEALLTKLRGCHKRVLIATDGVFSMDGDIAPLRELSALAEHHDAWLLADDAHGLGVVGGGRGSGFAQGGKAAIPLQMGTLSKAVGAYGGYVCGSSPVIELLRNRARTFIYSTGLPPAIVAAAIAALDVIEQQPDYAALPLAKAQAFARAALLPQPQSPIVPVVLGTAEAALAASAVLEENGFLVTAIRPPTVPPGTARLRLTFTAQHPDEEIERLAELVRTRILARIEPVAIPAQ